MPRVNRDIQRRMAARRERERRREPARRRYAFESATPPEQRDTGVVHEPNGTAEHRAAAARAATPPRAATARPSVRSFAEYRAEYAYVVGDLRRVAFVIGGLLIALVVLSLVLPR